MKCKRTIVSVEFGGRIVSHDPRRHGLWVSRSRIETLGTVTEQRHVFCGQRWIVTLRWTIDRMANERSEGSDER